MTKTSIPHPTSQTSHPDRERWLDAIVPLREGAELRGVHVDSLKRDPKTRAKILQVSARRLGIRRRDALMLD
jgi:hypothetical protein